MQNQEEPFKPPYIPELYLGCLDGLEGEEGMSILVRSVGRRRRRSAELTLVYASAEQSETRPTDIGFAEDVQYAVLPEHILLCPPTYAPQNLPPTPHQLALAYTTLLSASRHPIRLRRLLAFYNGGEGAGASQKWRHIQFVETSGGRAPVEEWVQGIRVDRPGETHTHASMPIFTLPVFRRRGHPSRSPILTHNPPSLSTPFASQSPHSRIIGEDRR